MSKVTRRLVNGKPEWGFDAGETFNLFGSDEQGAAQAAELYDAGQFYGGGLPIAICPRAALIPGKDSEAAQLAATIAERSARTDLESFAAMLGDGWYDITPLENPEYANEDRDLRQAVMYLDLLGELEHRSETVVRLVGWGIHGMGER